MSTGFDLRLRSTFTVCSASLSVPMKASLRMPTFGV